MTFPRALFQKIFIGSLLIVVSFNLFDLTQELRRVYNFRKLTPHQNIGIEFEGLQRFTRDVTVMGYYTDMNLDDDGHKKLFGHAQFVLVPTILDLNNTSHEYTLFVCKNSKKCVEKIKEINATPLKANSFGYILAKRY